MFRMNNFYIFLSNLYQYIIKFQSNVDKAKMFNEELYERLVIKIMSHHCMTEKDMKRYLANLVNIIKGSFEVNTLASFEILIENYDNKNKDNSNNTYIKL